MNPLYFGSSDRPLYGVYHAPKSRIGRRTGVVLCHSFGQEYMRSHRAFRQLAMFLAKAGFHVFRFDYRCTGDSSGDGEDFTLAGATDDTQQAIEELQDMADVEHVALLGLRLGGTTAARVAEVNDSVTHLVLWDAITDGGVYLDELRANANVHASVGGTAGSAAEPVTFGVMGFPVPPALQQELSGLRITDAAPARPVRALIVNDSDSADYRSLCTRYTVNGKPSDSMIAPLPGRWDEVDNWGSAMIPQEAIQSIVGWITSEVN